ncbi:MAG TPA: hypothetical protein VGL77_13165 [Armatimonadota bacterium]|jgi:hypothetical protein
MSCAVEALVERQMLLLGENTYGIAQRLHEEYLDAMAEFNARGEAEEAARRALAERQVTHAANAAEIAALTLPLTTENATVAFLQHQITQLTVQAALLADDMPELPAQCTILQQALAATPEDIPTHLTAYSRLAEEIATVLLTRRATAPLPDELANALALLRGEIAAPLLAGDACAALREDLAAQLATLEQLCQRQPAVAGQGLALLRQRLRRELHVRAEQQAAREASAKAQRLLTTEMLAKLQVLSQQNTLPEVTARATALLGRMQVALQSTHTDDPAPLRTLAQDVDALFHACGQALEEQAAAAYLSGQVTEVLLSLGYAVTQLPTDAAPGKHFVAEMGKQIGVEFKVDGTGRLGTHMVALSEDAVQSGEQAQEHVCALVDQVFTALRQRQLRLRERYRSSLAPGEGLPLLQLPETTENAPAREATLPLTMRMHTDDD